MSTEARNQTLAYLASFVQEDGPSADAVLATFGRCCLLLDGSDSGRRLATDEAATLGEALIAANDQRIELDPLVLASHFKTLKTESAAPPIFDVLMTKIAEELREQPAAIISAARVRHLRKLLSEEGFGPELVKDSPETIRFLAKPHEVLTMSDAQLSGLADHLSADTPAISLNASLFLAMVTLAALRDYRIDLGSKLLRLLLQSGCENTYIEEAVAFVFLQRCTNGSYGFIDPFLDHDIELAKRARGFHLPVTLNAVWLLHLWARGSRFTPAVPA